MGNRACCSAARLQFILFRTTEELKRREAQAGLDSAAVQLGTLAATAVMLRPIPSLIS